MVEGERAQRSEVQRQLREVETALAALKNPEWWPGHMVRCGVCVRCSAQLGSLGKREGMWRACIRIHRACCMNACVHSVESNDAALCCSPSSASEAKLMARKLALMAASEAHSKAFAEAQGALMEARAAEEARGGGAGAWVHARGAAMLCPYHDCCQL